MTQSAITLEDLRRALAEQDAQLAAAFAALDPTLPIAVPTASLRLLAEVCSSARSQSATGTGGNWASVRC
jgi:hypothetical protein